MEISINHTPHYSVLTVDGPIEGMDHGRIQRSLYDLLRRGHKYIVMDLGQVPYMNSTAVATLYSCSKEFDDHGGAINCARLNPKVEEVFRCLNAHALLEVHNSVESAGNSLQSVAA